MALGIGVNELKIALKISGAEHAKALLDALARSEREVGEQAAKTSPKVDGMGASFGKSSRGARAYGISIAGLQAPNKKLIEDTRQSTRAMNRMGGAAGQLQAQLLSLGAAFAVFGVGKKAVAVASEFEFGLARINTLLKDNGQQVEAFRGQLKELALESPKSLEDLTTALYQTISAGVDAADAMDVLTAAQKSAVAAGATTEQAVNATVTVLNAYKDTAITAAEVNDKLFAAIPRGRALFEDYEAELGTVATTAARFGVSVDEMFASVTTMTRAGFNAAEATTSLQASILGIASPSQQAAKFAKSLGLEFSASALKAKGFAGMMTEILDATGGSSDAMAKLFPNVRALRGAVVLTGPEFRGFINDIDGMRNSVGAADEAYKKMEGTFRTTSDRFSSQVKGVFEEVGSRIMPAVNASIKEFGDYLIANKDAIGNAAEGAFNAIKGVGGFILDHGDTLIQFMKGFFAARLITSATTALVAFGGALKGVLTSAIALGGKITGGLTYGAARAAPSLLKTIGGAISGLAKSPTILGLALTAGITFGEAIYDGMVEVLKDDEGLARTIEATLDTLGPKVERMMSDARAAGFGSVSEHQAHQQRVATGDFFVLGGQTVKPEEAVALGSGMVEAGTLGARADIESQIEQIEAVRAANSRMLQESFDKAEAYQAQIEQATGEWYDAERVHFDTVMLQRSLNEETEKQDELQHKINEDGRRLNELYKGRTNIQRQLVYWLDQETRERDRARRAAELDARAAKEKAEADAEKARKEREKVRRRIRARLKAEASEREKARRAFFKKTKAYLREKQASFKDFQESVESSLSKAMTTANEFFKNAEDKLKQHDAMLEARKQKGASLAQEHGFFGRFMLGDTSTMAGQIQAEAYHDAMVRMTDSTLMFARIGGDAIQGFAGVLSSSVGSAILDGKNFGTAMKDAFGEYIVGLGMMALQQSAYLAIISTLNAFFPVLGLPATGAGAAGAAALAVFGVAAIGAGKLMGAGSSGGRSSAGTSAGFGGGANAPSFRGSGREDGAPTFVFNLGISSQAVSEAVIDHSRTNAGRRGVPTVMVNGG